MLHSAAMLCRKLIRVAVLPVLVVGPYAGAPRPAGAMECIGLPNEYVIAPQATDPAIGQPLADHFAYLNPATRLRQQLLIWFPGSCAPPSLYRSFLREAANDGYHAIGLSYPNCPEINATCNAQQPIDPDCQEEMRMERLEGVDASPLITVTPPDAILNRIVKLLEFLETSHPGDGWGAFLDGAAPRWSSIAVAGHSQGGGHAANVGRLYDVARVVMFDWTDVVPLLGPAPWLSKPKVTPADRFYGLLHEGTFPTAVGAGWDALGLPAGTVNVDTTAEPYGNLSRLTTAVLDQGGIGDGAALHSAVIVDGVTPVRPDGTPVLSDVWRYLLGATPSEVIPVPSTKLSLKDSSTDPRARKIKFKAVTKAESDANRVRPPAPGSAGDPTVAGATLHVFNAEAGTEIASLVLPAQNWSGLGSDANPRGFRYRDPTTGAPIRQVHVEDDRLVIAGGKENWCYSLDEAQQGRIGLRLLLGAGVEWCAESPAKLAGTPPTTGENDRVGRFRGAPDTPPPPVCPLAPRAPLP